MLKEIFGYQVTSEQLHIPPGVENYWTHSWCRIKVGYSSDKWYMCAKCGRAFIHKTGPLVPSMEQDGCNVVCEYADR